MLVESRTVVFVTNIDGLMLSQLKNRLHFSHRSSNFLGTSWGCYRQTSGATGRAPKKCQRTWELLGLVRDIHQPLNSWSLAISRVAGDFSLVIYQLRDRFSECSCQACLDRLVARKTTAGLKAKKCNFLSQSAPDPCAKPPSPLLSMRFPGVFPASQ